LIRGGELCRSCGSRCRDIPSDAEPIEIECPTCSGLSDDCEACGGTGTFSLDRCPKDYVGNEIAEAVRLADYANGGMWPVAGGLLDQSAQFVSFVAYLKDQDAKVQIDKQERRNG